MLIIFSPVVSGKPADQTGKSLSMITDPSIDFHWFPLDNPGLVSIPLAFLLGWLGTVTSREQADGPVRRDGGPLAHRRTVPRRR